jgi:hypothetical protein
VFTETIDPDRCDEIRDALRDAIDADPLAFVELDPWPEGSALPWELGACGVLS